MRRALLLLAALLLAWPAAVQAQATQPAQRRLALVIGNQAYRSVPQLQNAGADARAIAAQLRARQFEVTDGYDLSRREMNRVFRDFLARLSAGSVAVVYFAGHGVQVDGTSYLLPVDIEPRTEADITDEGLSLAAVMDSLSRYNGRASNGLNLLIVDACRDNPMQGTGRSIGATRGLTHRAGSGAMVLYAASANQAALDRLGPEDRDPNGLFTRTLLRTMQQPGLGVRDLVQRVRADVIAAARGVGYSQVPAFYDEAEGEFVFTPGNAPPTVAASTAPTAPAGPVDRDALAWDSIRDSRRPEDFQAYLQAFPQGSFVPLARARLESLGAPAPGRTVATPTPAPAPVASGAEVAQRFPNLTDGLRRPEDPANPWRFGWRRNGVLEAARRLERDGLTGYAATSETGLPRLLANLTEAEVQWGGNLTSTPGGVVFQPGFAGHPLVARFTAPVAGAYRIMLRVGYLRANHVAWVVEQLAADHRPVFAARGDTTGTTAYTRDVEMQAGQEIVFAFGPGTWPSEGTLANIQASVTPLFR